MTSTSNSKTLLQCRCCLDDETHLSDLRSDYIVEGKRENYGEMLTACFGFQGPMWTRTELMLLICESCVSRLRDAYQFKQKIIETDQLLLNYFLEADVDTDDEESPNIEVSNSEDFGNKIQIEVKEEVKSKGGQDLEHMHADCDDDQVKEEPEIEEDENEECPYISDYDQYTEEVEYLEEEFMDGDNEDCSNADSKDVKRAVQTKRSRRGRSRKKRQTSGVRGSSSEGSKSRPKKTHEFHGEIRTVLTFTNGTPFKKIHGGEYQCLYCSAELTWRTLRAHVDSEHANERVDVTDYMTPAYMHEILKLDIQDLQCTTCTVPIPSWNDMFTHLKDSHHVDLDLAYTRIVPYIIQQDLHCALCQQQFINFSMLDVHMNSHYSNYICSKCGDSFLAEYKLNKHLLIHDKGVFPCDICGKVFSLDRYRVKHVSNVHKKQPQIYCPYCKDKFNKENALRTHIAEKHKDSKKHACELCPKVFDLRTHYMKHMRLTHGDKEKKFKCKLCDKRFLAPYALRNHEKWHMDDKTLKCKRCNTKFCTKQYLEKHELKCGTAAAGRRGRPPTIRS